MSGVFPPPFSGMLVLIRGCMPQQFQIPKEDFDFSQTGVVTINNKALADNLKNNKSVTLDSLKQAVAEIDIQKIKLDPQGRVVISDREFHDQVKTVVDGMTIDDRMVNFGCGAGC